MVIYDSAGVYINSVTDAKDKIVRIDAVINALLETAAKAAANDNITEYTLDSGQTKIKTMYRGAASVMASIKAFETLKQIYVNQVNGRVIRLVDSKNFVNGRWRY